jgi:hypothetical protein
MRKRRQQSKKLKSKVDKMVDGSQTFLKAKLSVDCKQLSHSFYCLIQYPMRVNPSMTQWGC